MKVRHFLSLLDLSQKELLGILDRAIELKKKPINSIYTGKVLGMIFEKASTRTRLSFEAGMSQLGGSAIFLSPRDTQLGRGEPLQDSARVISAMTDIIMVRTFSHKTIETFAHYSCVPVINALTDALHPCQLLADMQTFLEERGSIEGKKVAWIGDGNNMCQSYMNASEQFGFKLSIACPEGFEPEEKYLLNRSNINISSNPVEAVHGADLVVTDVWASMGQEKEQSERILQFKNFQVNHELMENAAKDAIFMHCLPAHRGEEVSEELLEDKKISMVWKEAENRLHSQKALIEFLLG